MDRQPACWRGWPGFRDHRAWSSYSPWTCHASPPRRFAGWSRRCDGDGALLVDEDGRRQYLCAVYRTEALLAAAPPLEEQHGLPMRRLVDELRLAEVPALAGETRDIDTWDDLLELREQLGE